MSTGNIRTEAIATTRVTGYRIQWITVADREEAPAADQETADQAEEILPEEAAEAIPVEIPHHHRHRQKLQR
ncbi:hypothetical protein [Paenibacillus alginolyticus]|uniref:hypothetical protein n=1 Tax=Paenibacillus alginolyticus TaxID=59839 RepID=UPI001FD0F43D|nr:hypothetical protein [Paenibacillus alginolyticus]